MAVSKNVGPEGECFSWPFHLCRTATVPASSHLPSPRIAELLKRYKEFLDSLVPPEWFEEQHRIKRERQEERRQARIKQKRKSYEVYTSDGMNPDVCTYPKHRYVPKLVTSVAPHLPLRSYTI